MHKNALFLALQALGIFLLTLQIEAAIIPAVVKSYGKSLAEDIGVLNDSYAQITNKAPTKYLLDLATLGHKLQEQGDLDGIIAVQSEIKRYKEIMESERDPFEDLPEMPQEALVASPEELRTLQEKYIADYHATHEAYTKKVAERAEKYIQQVQNAQVQLTKAGRIEEAKAVRDELSNAKELIAKGEYLTLVDKFNGSIQVASSSSYTSVSSWDYRGTKSFSRDILNAVANDIPDEFTTKVNERTGAFTVRGTAGVSTFQSGASLCEWRGKAFVWNILNITDLEATISYDSKTLSEGHNKGPDVTIIVFVGNKKKAMLSTPIQRTHDTIKIVRNPNKIGEYSLFWPFGKKNELFEIPEGAKVSVLVGVELHNPGEIADITFNILN